MTNSTENKRAFGLDLIRAAAIVLVLMSHTFPGGTMFPMLGVARDFWGVWGVEIFFVLSGYLICGILISEFYAGRLTGPAGLLAFWKRRWFRTLPNYYLFLILFLFINLWDQGLFPYGFVNYLWFGQALYYQHPVFFLLSWSLAIEEWFYLTFPIVLLIFSKCFARRERAVLITIIVFIVVPMLLRYFLQNAGWVSGVRLTTLPRLDAIAYGAALAFVRKHHVGVWNFLAKIWPVGAAAVVAVFVHACWHTFTQGEILATTVFYRVFYFCLISAGLMMLFPKIADLNPTESWWTTIIRKLSLWSYSMYLSHLFCFWWIGKAFKFCHAEIRAGSWTQVAGDMTDWVVTLVFSAMLYKYYEKPFMDLRDRTGKKRPETQPTHSSN